MRRPNVLILLLALLAGCSSPERVTVNAPISTVAQDAELDPDTIDKFLGALVRLHDLEIPDDAEFAFEPRVFDEDGRYSPFSANMGLLDGLPEQQEQAGRIIDAAGLGTTEEFLDIGDRIYRAYAAVSLEEESRQGSGDAEELMTIAETVPEADRIAVREYFERLTEIFERGEQ